MSGDWSMSSPDPDRTVYRRAGGRRRYNRLRQDLALERRLKVLALLKTGGRPFFKRGVGAEIARALGVSRSTVWRDMRAMFWPWRGRGPGEEREWPDDDDRGESEDDSELE